MFIFLFSSLFKIIFNILIFYTEKYFQGSSLAASDSSTFPSISLASLQPHLATLMERTNKDVSQESASEAMPQ